MLRALSPPNSASVFTCGAVYRAGVLCLRLLSEKGNRGPPLKGQADWVPGRTLRVHKWLKQFKPHVQERLEFEHQNGHRRGYKHKDAPPQPMALGKQLLETKAKEDPKFASKLSKVGANRIRKMQWWAANRSMVVQQQIREGLRLERERVHAWLMGSGDAPRLGDGRQQKTALESGQRKLLGAPSLPGQKDSNRQTPGSSARRGDSASVPKNRSVEGKGAENASSWVKGRSGAAGVRKAGMCTWTNGRFTGLGDGSVRGIYPLGTVASILQLSHRGLTTGTKKGAMNSSLPGPQSAVDYTKELKELSEKKQTVEKKGGEGEDGMQAPKAGYPRMVKRDGSHHAHIRYDGGWNPKRRLTRAQMDYVKELHEKAIKRILRSKFQPDEKRLSKLKDRDLKQKEDKKVFFKNVKENNVQPKKRPKPLSEEDDWNSR